MHVAVHTKIKSKNTESKLRGNKATRTSILNCLASVDDGTKTRGTNTERANCSRIFRVDPKPDFGNIWKSNKFQTNYSQSGWKSIVRWFVCSFVRSIVQNNSSHFQVPRNSNALCFACPWIRLHAQLANIFGITFWSINQYLVRQFCLSAKLSWLRFEQLSSGVRYKLGKAVTVNYQIMGSQWYTVFYLE